MGIKPVQELINAIVANNYVMWESIYNYIWNTDIIDAVTGRDIVIDNVVLLYWYIDTDDSYVVVVGENARGDKVVIEIPFNNI